ncbi:MAG: hypothetical protein JWP34_5147 [Massilia sp.]|jgi:uncharacterized protein (TIGR00369 family)|nr:hypothetical protein [Massilia sp.]
MTATSSAPANVPFVVCGAESAFRVGPITADGDTIHAMMQTGEWIEGPDGRPAFGSLGVLIDDMLGYAIVRVRPEGHWATSTEIHVEFSDHLPQDGSLLHAESRAVVLDRSSGLAQGRIFDRSGRTIALGSQRLRFVPGTPAALAMGADPPVFESRNGTTMEQLGGTLTRHQGGARLTFPLGPDVSNPMGTLHGGIMLCATEIAGHHAVQNEEHPLTTAAVHIAYLRPGPVEGEVTFEAMTVHRGRSLAIAQVVSRNAQGKICTHATVTSHAA